MRKLLLSVVLSFFCGALWAHPILESFAVHDFERLIGPEGSPAAVETLGQDVAFLKERGLVPANARLFVKKHGPLGEAQEGGYLLLNEKLVQEPREVRLFVIAHEGNHLFHQDHESAMDLVQSAIPTYFDSTAALSAYDRLKPQLKEKAYAYESRADREAYQGLVKLGLPMQAAVTKFFTERKDSATDWHPAALDRLKALCRLKK